MRIYGLTGSIGSGKSTVAEEFERLGAIILDADVISRIVVTPPSKVLQEIVEMFGQEVLAPDKTLNRKRLGEI
ncbi:MAG: dephospho-CoA kinase, partial [Bdellovibrionales bacterium]|nr:dephospho-CoA kinase [Bdellovibrionales bacterium]